MVKYLQDIDFLIGFASGAFVHFVMLWTRADFFPPRCHGGSCSEILFFDIPISILYYAFEDSKIILMSLLVGSVLWGIVFAFLLRFIKSQFDKRS